MAAVRINDCLGGRAGFCIGIARSGGIGSRSSAGPRKPAGEPDRYAYNVHSFLGAALQAGGDLLRREYALVYCAGLLNKTVPVEVALWDKSYDFAPLLIFKRSVSSPIGGGKSSHMHPSA
jgi:hypothetical protein